MRRRGGTSDFLMAGAGFCPALPEKYRRSRHLRDQLELIRRGNAKNAPILAREARFVLSTLKKSIFVSKLGFLN
jgi:hypothetical protein